MTESECLQLHNKDTPRPILPNIHPVHHDDKALSPWVFRGGLIAAGVLVVLIITVVIVIVTKVRKRKRENNRMALSYSRLSADGIPDDDEDVQMLLS